MSVIGHTGRFRGLSYSQAIRVKAPKYDQDNNLVNSVGFLFWKAVRTV